jgi:regulator of protease activity HflC (stomatin/prohibitin superfamily)
MAKRGNERSTYERTVNCMNGWAGLALFIVLAIAAPATFIATIAAIANDVPWMSPALAVTLIIGSALLGLVAFLMLFGFFTLQPNEARVLILFGKYKGTAREPGFWFANPFYARSRGAAPSRVGETTGEKAVDLLGRKFGLGRLSTKLSLRARNFESHTLKVNDKRGNPVEIAAVVVWRVDDTAQAVFDVEEFESYVAVQAESAIRSVASHYAYDHGEGDEITLRGGGDEVAARMTAELHDRLEIAGVKVEESRITHLAYAPEIASAMLRRQQAEAVIDARNKIVLGAVSMVEMALKELEDKAVVKLDEERRAAMVSNLLVVLCGTSEASPVINTGTLYS